MQADDRLPAHETDPRSYRFENHLYPGEVEPMRRHARIGLGIGVEPSELALRKALLRLAVLAQDCHRGRSRRRLSSRMGTSV